MKKPRMEILVFIYVFNNVINALQLPDILWDPTNPIFNETLCGKDANKLYAVETLDSLSIVCGNRDLSNAPLSVQKPNLNYHYNILFTESKTIYEQRKLDRNQVTVLKYCAQEFSSIQGGILKPIVDRHPLFFNPYTATNGPKFVAGKTYYFFTTSDGTEKSLNNTNASPQGRHMAFQVYICDKADDENCWQRNIISRCRDERIPVTGERFREKNDGIYLTTASIVIAIITTLVCGLILSLVCHRAYLFYSKKNGKNKKEMNDEGMYPLSTTVP